MYLCTGFEYKLGNIFIFSFFVTKRLFLEYWTKDSLVAQKTFAFESLPKLDYFRLPFFTVRFFSDMFVVTSLFLKSLLYFN